MLYPANNRVRPKSSEGAAAKLHGEYRLSVPSGALTTVAAGTATAGHLFAFRNPSTTKRVIVRLITVDFNLTVAFGAAQAMGLDLMPMRAYTVNDTGGTAIDVGSTVSKTGAIRTDQANSAITANCVRMGTTGALTAGTHTADANAIASCQKWMSAVGIQFSATLLDARDDGSSTVRSPLELAQDEGFKIRNTILMGATGVGTLIATVEWDEITL